MFKIKEKNKTNVSADDINLDLLEQIQPGGGIYFKDEKYICTGNSYEACIHVYGYAQNIDEFWLTYLTNISNVVVTIDVMTEDIQTVQENINKNIKEQNQRYIDAKDSVSKEESKHEYQKNKMLLEQLIKMDDVVRLIMIRIFVTGGSKEYLDKTCSDIINHLAANGYKAAVFLNENEYEWKSMYYSYNDQLTKLEHSGIYKRIGQPVLASILAKGDPFHYSSLSDDYGSWWGDTDVGGSVIFDPFYNGQDRISYNMVLFGNMGSGKSTTLKKLVKDQAIRKNYIRGFDITGEFTPLIKQLGGKVISLDGKDGMINPLEILRSVDSIDGNEKGNWQNHVSKISTMYSYLVPGVDQYELSYFQIILKDFYIAIGIYPQDESRLNAPTGVITSLSPQEYPILEDFRDFLIAMKDRGLVEEVNSKRHDNITLIITNLVENYGNIFNGYTSMDNILAEQIVYFNISSVLKVKDEILNTLLYNILSLCWDNLIQIGTPMKEAYDRGEISIQDATKFLIVIDEAHRIVSTTKIAAVQQLLGFQREARKYFGGLVLATQSIRDYVSEGASDKEIDAIKLLFELSQYKMAMTQDNNVIPMLKRIFSGQLTNSLIEQVPRLSKGETILALSNRHSIKFKIKISEEEKRLFAGGA